MVKYKRPGRIGVGLMGVWRGGKVGVVTHPLQVAAVTADVS